MLKNKFIKVATSLCIGVGLLISPNIAIADEAEDLQQAKKDKTTAEQTLAAEVEKSHKAKEKAVDTLAQQTEQAYKDAEKAQNNVEKAAQKKEKAVENVNKAKTDLNVSKKNLDEAQVAWDQVDKDEADKVKTEAKDQQKKTDDVKNDYDASRDAKKKASDKVNNDTKALDNAKSVEAEAKKAKDKAKSVLDESEATYQEAKDYYDYLVANDDSQELIAKAEKDLQTSKDNRDNAQKALNDAQDVVDNASTQVETKKKDRDKASSNVKKAQSQLESTQSRIDDINDNLNKAIATRDALMNDANSDDEAVQKAQDKVDTAREAKRKAEEKVNDIERQLEKAKADRDLAEAKFKQGARGFFTAVGSDAALKELDDNEEFGLYDLDNDIDATSLENMKTSLALLRDMNAHRERENREEGTQLEPLTVTHWLMARSQLSANGGVKQLFEDGTVNHYQGDGLYAQPGSEAEILAFMKDRDSYHDDSVYANGSHMWELWYDEEKDNYKSNNGGQTGHYLVIVAPESKRNTMGAGISCYSDEYMALAGGARCFAVMRTHSNDMGEQTYTVEEYEKMFLDYYKSVDTKELQKKVDDLNKALDKANNDITIKDGHLATAINDKKSAEKRRDATYDNLNNAKLRVSSLQNDKTNAIVQRDNDIEALSQAKSRLDDAKKALHDAESSLTSATSNRDVAMEKVNKAKKDVQDKQAKLDALLNDTALSDAKASKDKAKADRDSAQNVFDSRSKQYQKAVDNRVDAKAILDKSIADLDNASAHVSEMKSRYDAARQLNDEVQKRYNTTFEPLFVLQDATASYEEASKALMAANDNERIANNEFIIAVDNANQARDTYELFASIDKNDALKYGIANDDERLKVVSNLFALYLDSLARVENAKSNLDVAQKAYDTAVKLFNKVEKKPSSTHVATSTSTNNDVVNKDDRASQLDAMINTENNDDQEISIDNLDPLTNDDDQDEETNDEQSTIENNNDGNDDETMIDPDEDQKALTSTDTAAVDTTENKDNNKSYFWPLIILIGLGVLGAGGLAWFIIGRKEENKE